MANKRAVLYKKFIEGEHSISIIRLLTFDCKIIAIFCLKLKYEVVLNVNSHSYKFIKIKISIREKVVENFIRMSDIYSFFKDY